MMSEVFIDLAIDLVKEMMCANPEERPSWEQVLENEWLLKMTEDEEDDPQLVDVDPNNSSSAYIDV